MHIGLVARSDPSRDPHARALATMLHRAGHRVAVVCRAAHDPVDVPGVRVHPVPEPANHRLARALARLRGQPIAARRTAALRSAAAGLDLDLVHVLRPDDLDLVPAGVPVVGQPGWPEHPQDLVDSAPRRPALAADVVPSDLHTPADDRSPSTPAPDRHRGRRVAVAARFTPTNPSRYLLAALRRAGVDVIELDGEVAWDRVPADTDAVLVVESPYPALEVTGSRPDGVPLLLWVHHGEHHVDANARLAERYDADAVLLAHSWHLAHRFRAPVHRFPFAVAPELFDGGRDFAERDVDVAMVAAGLGDEASVRYPRRAAWTTELAPLGERAVLTYGLRPAEMAALYGRSRVVLNDGGVRHRPITMRVFEAIGAGALLVTEPLPGTEVLLEPTHWESLGTDVLAQVRALADDPHTAVRARAALEHARGRHTYDHRVDELLTVATATERLGPAGFPAPTGVSAVVDRDVEVGTVAALAVDIDLPDRAVATGDDARARLARGRFDTVVLGPGATAEDRRLAAAGARRYLLTPAPVPADLAAAVGEAHEDAAWGVVGAWARADLGAKGYRVRSGDHPLAGGRP